MKRNIFYAGAFLAALGWLGYSSGIRAQQGQGPGPGPGGPEGQPSPNSNPDVPGSGPQSPIDQPNSAPGSGYNAIPGSEYHGTGLSNGIMDQAAAERVRGAIMSDPSLIAFNQDIQVGVSKGKILLSGKVGTQQEKELIAAKAALIVGPGNIDNQIAVH